MAQRSWFVVGFTADDISGAWQHWRLAQECGRALEADGMPPSFGILEGAGFGDHPLRWYVSAEAARLLDARDVPWRRFVIGSVASAPTALHPAIGPP